MESPTPPDKKSRLDLFRANLLHVSLSALAASPVVKSPFDGDGA